MKSILMSLLFALLTNAFFAQSFQKGSIVLDFKGELALYNTLSEDKTNKVSNEDKAASRILNLSGEYGLTSWLGVGLKLQRSNYFVEKDTANKGQADQYIYTPSVVSYDFAAVVNGHFVRTKKIDLYGGISFGYSNLNYQWNDKENTRANGGGSWIDLHLAPRFYFGERFGLNVNLGYSFFNYPSITFQNDNQLSDLEYSLKGSGLTFGLGFHYRFLKFQEISK